MADLKKALHFAQLRMELRGGYTLPANPLPRITMSAYVKANNIGFDIDPLFYALDQWIEQGVLGNEPTREYIHFMKLLNNYINEQAERAEHGEG